EPRQEPGPVVAASRHRGEPDKRGQAREAAGRFVEVVDAQRLREVGMSSPLAAEEVRKRCAGGVEQPRPRESPERPPLGLPIGPDRALRQVKRQRDNLDRRQRDAERQTPSPGRWPDPTLHTLNVALSKTELGFRTPLCPPLVRGEGIKLSPLRRG